MAKINSKYGRVVTKITQKELSAYFELEIPKDFNINNNDLWLDYKKDKVSLLVQTFLKDSLSFHNDSCLLYPDRKIGSTLFDYFFKETFFSSETFFDSEIVFEKGA